MNDTITPAELMTKLISKKDIQILDVRRKNDIDSDPTMIPGATWHDPDPAKAEIWAEDLSPEKEVVIYCARGGSVSKTTTEMLRNKGLSVQFVEGGIAGWKENGGEVKPR